MSEQNGKNSTAKPAAKSAPKAESKTAAAPDPAAKKPADGTAKKSTLGGLGGAIGMDGSAATWKRVALALFVVAGLAIVAAVDYASDA